MSGGPTLPGMAEEATKLSDEWYTPRWVLEPLGYFDLDPCSPLQRPWDIADRHLTIADDGLTQEWEGRVWLNPPYSESGQWVRKMSFHNHGTALLFARVETGTWQDYVWPVASGIFFIRGRIAFQRGADTATSARPDSPSALIAYGPVDAAILSDVQLRGHFVRLR